LQEQKSLQQWLKEHELTAVNTLLFIKGIEDDVKELSKGLGIEVKLVIDSDQTNH
jgi:hypothetical protein